MLIVKLNSFVFSTEQIRCNEIPNYIFSFYTAMSR